ncbi:MAG TPA: hypothetical protein VFE98_08275 [Candidatus Bathyarchaeia archaeon]|nr:hypothetical protein [Candidatus Bathyarchaeia archaeon]
MAVQENAKNWKMIVPPTASNGTETVLQNYQVQIIEVPAGPGLAYKAGPDKGSGISRPSRHDGYGS